MFGHRPDGKIFKNLPGLFKIIPMIMPQRNDAQVLFDYDIRITKMDEYMDRVKAEKGINLSYLDIFFATIVRIFSERTQLNRFVVNQRIYQRNKITISLVIKKGLSDDAEETPLKFDFKGNETIFEIKEKVEKIIQENKAEDATNGTDNLVSTLNAIPTPILKKVVWFLKWLDKHGMLPKSIIDIIPFHTSAFVTNVGSIGIDAIYHHLYNFGTTSMFLGIGRKKKNYLYDDDEIKEEKCINLKFVGDERICDGVYYANSFKLLSKYLRKPELLEQPGENIYDVNELIALNKKKKKTKHQIEKEIKNNK